MTRDEILNEINYHGKYTKDVKRKLNKLLKEYHPDNNKEDKNTILILYEIKKELEEGSIEYSSNEEKIVDDTSKAHVMFLESILNKLKKEREKINKKIEDLYIKINKLGKDKNLKQEELYDVETKILDINNDMEELIKIDIIDKLLIFFILFSSIGLLISKSIIVVVLIIIFLLIELFYIYIRYIDYKDKKKKIKRIKNKFKNINEEYNDIENDLEELGKEEVKLKKERNKINNDIYRYSRELNNIKENNNVKEEMRNRRK